MSRGIGQEKVAYVSQTETRWCVAIRDGTGFAHGLFTTHQRNYYDTVEEAKKAAKRRVESGVADRVETNVMAQAALDE